MTALGKGQCVATFVHGPGDGYRAIVELQPVELDGEQVLTPPARIGYSSGLKHGPIAVYVMDHEQMAIEADGTEVYVYRHAPDGVLS